jgi:hypothetical protein
MNHGFGPYAVVVLFWLTSMAVVVAGIISDYRRRRDILDLIRTGIEHGHPVDPALIANLTQRSKNPGFVPNSLMVAGILSISGGIGFMILGSFLGSYKAILPVIGIGLVAACIGVGFLISAKYVRRNQKDSRLQGSAA